ncbi:MAG: MMPL family transporter, partial [Winogradskyella sp.]|nr:MMPL family transporter [Winogradskyella sp.]
IIIVLVTMTTISAYFTINRLSVDNSLSIWFLEDNPSYNAYIDYQEQFGSDEIFVGMFPVNNALESSNINKLKELHQAIDSLWFVKESFSLANAKYPIYVNEAIVYDDLYTTERSEKGLKSLYGKLPNIIQQLVTEDYKNLFFYVQLKPTPFIEKSRAEIAPAIRERIEKHLGDIYFLTGAPVLNEAYSLGIYKESLVFGILTILVITVMLLFLLPDKRYLPMALFSVAMPITILFGIITSLGFALNMISMLIPTILMVYSVSDVVHIINIYQKEGLSNAHIGKSTLIALAIRKSLTPCFYTTLTTIVGYFALYLSPLPAFKNMGVFTCLGLLLSFILVYIISTIGFSFLHSEFTKDRPILKLKNFNYHHVIGKINELTWSYRNAIILVFSIFLIIGLGSVLYVKLDTNSLDLLAEGKAKQDLRTVESQLNGSSRLQLNITSLDGDEVVTKETISALEDFQNKLETINLLANPVSIIDIKKFLEKRTPVLFQSNVSAASTQNLLKNNELESGSFYKLFSEDLKTLGIAISVKEVKTSELEALLDGIEKSFNSSFDASKYKLTI